MANQPNNQAPKIPAPPQFTKEEAEALSRLFGPKLDRKRIEQHMAVQYGVDADELKVLYPSDDALMRFFLDEVSCVKRMDSLPPEKGETVLKDTYKLTRQNQRDLDEINLAKKREARRQKQEVLKAVKLPDAKDAKAKAEFEQAAAHLPAQEKMSYEEMIASIRAGLSDKLDKADEHSK